MKVFSIIGNLAGGGGRVLNDIVNGLHDHEQKVFYEQPLAMWSFGYGAELDSAGVPHKQVADQKEFADICNHEKPDIVLYHWWKGACFHRPENPSVPWVLIGHTQLPMPLGYDYYVALGDIHYALQKHISKDKKTRIYNGVDLKRYRPQAQQERTVDYFTLGRASHLKETKISLDYIDFFASLDIPNKRQIIIGDGPMLQPLMARVKQLGVADKFQFTNEINNAEMVDMLGTFDMSCYLTDTHLETFSIVLLEKLAMGIPIVAQPRGGIIDQVVHNMNGFLSYHGSDLKRYCELLYKHEDLRMRLSNGARESAKKFDIKIQQAAYRDLVEKLG